MEFLSSKWEFFFPPSIELCELCGRVVPKIIFKTVFIFIFVYAEHLSCWHLVAAHRVLKKKRKKKIESEGGK